MDNEGDWILVEDNDELVIELETISICEKAGEEESNMENKSNYVSALLKNAQQNHHQQQSVLSTLKKKEKFAIKRDDEHETIKIRCSLIVFGCLVW
jgi:viroplasmin and RNaseH domain-containing protein